MLRDYGGDVSNALAYWYKKGSEEVKNFNKSELINRIAIEKDGILYSRIMDGHRFIIAAGFNKTSLGKEVQLDLLTPVLDRPCVLFQSPWAMRD